MTLPNDKILIKQLGSLDTLKVNEASTYLYSQHYNYISKFVRENSGSACDAEDVWQETMLAFRQQLVSQKITAEKLECKLTTYLYAIGRNIWLKTLHKKKRTTSITLEHKSLPSKQKEVLSVLVDKDRKNLIKSLIDQLDANSKAVLIYFYFQKWSVESIAIQMGYANEQVAKNKLCKARKKLKRLVELKYNKQDF